MELGSVVFSRTDTSQVNDIRVAPSYGSRIFIPTESLSYDLKRFQISKVEKSREKVESIWVFEKLVRHVGDCRERKNQTSPRRREISQLRVFTSAEKHDPVFDSCGHPIPYFLRVDPESCQTFEHACRRTGTRLGKQSDETLKIIVITHFRRITRRTFSTSSEPRVKFSKQRAVRERNVTHRFRTVRHVMHLLHM